MIKIEENLGFDGRIFLTKEEWKTYLRRKPVRFIKKRKPTNCEICGTVATEENPLENAHIIGFRIGLLWLNTRISR